MAHHNTAPDQKNNLCISDVAVVCGGMKLSASGYNDTAIDWNGCRILIIIYYNSLYVPCTSSQYITHICVCNEVMFGGWEPDPHFCCSVPCRYFENKQVCMYISVILILATTVDF